MAIHESTVLGYDGAVVLIDEFPWHSLPRVDRSTIKRSSALHRKLGAAFDCSALPATLAELLSSEIELESDVPTLAPQPDFSPETVCLQSRDRSLAFMVELEADLAAAAVARLLGRPVPSAELNRPLDNVLCGALAAIVLDAGRRVSKAPVLEYVQSLAPELCSELGHLFAWQIRLDRRRYGAHIWFVCDPNRSGSPPAKDQLKKLASLQLGVPLVVGLAVSSEREFQSLLPGDVWLADDGFWIDESLNGSGALAAPEAESGFAVDVSADRIVLGKACRALPIAVESSMTKDNEPKDSLSQTAVEVPIVVRVELGTVTLTAAEWAELGTGDVIETEARLSGPVALRVGGRQIAEGELVNLEGRIGVRITALGGRSQF